MFKFWVNVSMSSQCQIRHSLQDVTSRCDVTTLNYLLSLSNVARIFLFI